jgi:hypothetical protein
MHTFPDLREHTQESQLRRVAHKHDIQHAIARIGLWRDLHPGAEVRKVRDHHAVAGEFLWCRDRARSRGGGCGIHMERHWLPAGERPQSGDRVYEGPANQPGIIGDLSCRRGDTDIDAACYSHLTPALAGKCDQIHRPGFAREQQPGSVGWAKRDAICPRKVIAASGRDHAEYAITTRLRLSHSACDCARHAVSAKCDDQVTPYCRLGSDGACVPEAAALADQVAGAGSIQDGSDRWQMPDRPSTTSGRVDHDGQRTDHGNLHG